MFIFVHFCLFLFIFVYFCLFLFTFVYFGLLLFIFVLGFIWNVDESNGRRCGSLQKGTTGIPAHFLPPLLLSHDTPLNLNSFTARWINREHSALGMSVPRTHDLQCSVNFL